MRHNDTTKITNAHHELNHQQKSGDLLLWSFYFAYPFINVAHPSLICPGNWILSRLPLLFEWQCLYDQTTQSLLPNQLHKLRYAEIINQVQWTWTTALHTETVYLKMPKINKYDLSVAGVCWTTHYTMKEFINKSQKSVHETWMLSSCSFNYNITHWKRS